MLKRMKRLLRLRNKSGFTLVEVIIACALLGILIVGMMGFMTPVLSGVRQQEKNARALMLQEAMVSYIANNIQYAYYVQPIIMAASGDTDPVEGGDPAVLAMQYQGTEFGDYTGKGLADLLNFFKNDLAGEVFEIRCIGIRWIDIPGEGNKKKLMLTNEKVDQTTCALDPDEAQLVFESVFYDDLYPVIKFENYNNQYQLKDADGNMVDQVDEGDVNIAPGIKITADVYLTPECYNTNEAVREDTMLAYSGWTYATLSNIGSSLMNSTGVYKNQPIVSAHTVTEDGAVVPSYLNAFNSDTADSSYVGDAGKVYYYPNSYIYFIARKNKTASDPSTPAPAPEESEPEESTPET